MLQLLTFGGLELAPGAPGARRPLVLAAYLAVEGPQLRRHLAELFCEGSRDPLNQLSVNLTRLRRLLRAAGLEAALRAGPSNVSAELTTDLRRFGEALELGDVWRAVELHRGPFLAGHEAGLPEGLAAWVLAVREAQVRGLQRAVVAEASALAGAGRHAEAAALADAGYAAAGRGGSDPRLLGALHELMALGGGARSAEALAEASALGVARDPAGAAPRPKAPPAPSNLAAPGGATLGRERERLELAALLRRREVRLVTLVGEGGVGKSRLAMQVAADRHAVNDYPGGVAAMQAHLADGAELEARCLAALGACGVGRAGGAAPSLAAVSGPGFLLVLDDVGPTRAELDAAADWVGALLARVPGLKVLATAERRLGLPEEHLLPVAGLGAAGAELYAQRVAALYPGRRPSAGEAEAAERLSAALGGNPLALGLAAGLAGALDTHAVVALLEADPRVLGEQRGVPRRLASPALRFEHALAGLSGAAAAALLRLAYFEPDFSREGALEVSGAQPLALVELLEASLVNTLPSGRLGLGPLTRRLALLRLGDDPALLAATADAHLAYYAALPVRHYQAAFGPEQARVQELLVAELPNSLLAFRHGLRTLAADAVGGILLGCHALYARQGRFGEAIGLCDQALAAFGDGATVAGLLLAVRANHLGWLGRTGEARANAEAALARLGDTDPFATRLAHLALATCAVARHDAAAAAEHYDLVRDSRPLEYAGVLSDSAGLVQLLAGDLAAAAATLRKAILAHREHGNAGQEAVATFRLGVAEYRRGRLGRARRCFERALELAHGVYPYYEHASRLGLGATLRALGGVAAGAAAAGANRPVPVELAVAAAELLVSVGVELPA